jgi:Arc/MetJ-type ribon-helix-helix transcriptional regulator
MAMAITQVRLPEGLIEEMDSLVEKGHYTSKSDVIRDAIRKLLLERQIGTAPNRGNSVKEVRELRKRLPRPSLKEINRLG